MRMRHCGLLTVYAYTVLAFDGAGNESRQAASVQVQTRGIVVPGGVASVGRIGQIDLSWQANGEEDLLGYNVYRSSRSDRDYERLAGSEGTPYTTGQTSFVDAGLPGEALFFYRVSAVTGQGESEASVFVSGRSLADEMAPAVPQNLSVVADESDFGRVTVRWSASVRDGDGGELTGLAGYVVFRSEETGDSFVEVGQVTGVQFVDEDLSASKTYVYTVHAFDGAGNESRRASPVQVETQGPDQVAPAVPQNLSAVADESDFGRVTVHWSAPVQDGDGDELTGLAGYVVFRSEGGTNSFAPVDTLGAEMLSFVDPSLRALTVYAYTVLAFDGAGNESRQAGSVQVQTRGIVVPGGRGVGGSDRADRPELAGQRRGRSAGLQRLSLEPLGSGLRALGRQRRGALHDGADQFRRFEFGGVGVVFLPGECGDGAGRERGFGFCQRPVPGRRDGSGGAAESVGSGRRVGFWSGDGALERFGARWRWRAS